jgi:MFS family permease
MVPRTLWSGLYVSLEVLTGIIEVRVMPLKMDERRPDSLGLGRLLIYQDEKIFKFTIDPILVATVSESTPPETRGSILATFNSSASLAMVVAPSATGLIAQWTGSFDVSFYMAGAFHLIALVSVIQAMRILGKHKARNASVAKQSVTAD